MARRIQNSYSVGGEVTVDFILGMGFLVLAAAPTPTIAGPPTFAVRQDPRPVDVAAWITEKLPRVEARAGRWPLVFWTNGAFTLQPRTHYEALLARGATQHVQLDRAHIPIALAVQAAGSPVVVMEGQGGRWPATLAGDMSVWGHRFDPGYKPPKTVHPCLMWLDGWATAGRRVRETLLEFRRAGVTVDAVWMDWEGDPMSDWKAHEQARNCERCRRTIPPRAMVDEGTFRHWRGQYWMDLLGAYLGAPVKEIFPAAEVTNWMVNVSTPEAPLRYWTDRELPPAIPAMMTATNTVAYGSTDFFAAAWKAEWPLDREHVDQLYTHLLLRMVSDDTRNRRAWAPGLKSFPWVARWVDETREKDRPILSRERYREVLRHLWLRGADGMQVFNPVVEGYEHMALAEAEDALAIHAEMQAAGDLLEGEPLNLDIPPPQSDDAFWSGRRRADRAIVRAFKPGSGEAPVRVEAWPGHVVTLLADGSGRTYRLRLEAGGIEVEKARPGR